MSTFKTFFKNLFTPARPVVKPETSVVKQKSVNELIDESNDILKKYNQGGGYQVTEEQMQDMKKKFYDSLAFYTTKNPSIEGVEPLDIIIKASETFSEFTNPISKENLIRMVKDEFYRNDEIARSGESFCFKSETFWYSLKMNYSTGECHLELRVPFRFN